MSSFNKSVLDSIYKAPIIKKQQVPRDPLWQERRPSQKRKSAVIKVVNLSDDESDDSVVEVRDVKKNVASKNRETSEASIPKLKPKEKKPENFSLPPESDSVDFEDKIKSYIIDKLLDCNANIARKTSKLLSPKIPTTPEKNAEKIHPDEEENKNKDNLEISSSEEAPKSVRSRENYCNIISRNIIDSFVVSSYNCSLSFDQALKLTRLKIEKRIRNSTDKILKCKECNFAANLAKLKRHLIVHKKKFPFKCTKCAYASARREKIRFHMNIKHMFK